MLEDRGSAYDLVGFESGGSRLDDYLTVTFPGFSLGETGRVLDVTDAGRALEGLGLLLHAMTPQPARRQTKLTLRRVDDGSIIVLLTVLLSDPVALAEISRQAVELGQATLSISERIVLALGALSTALQGAQQVRKMWYRRVGSAENSPLANNPEANRGINLLKNVLARGPEHDGPAIVVASASGTAVELSRDDIRQLSLMASDNIMRGDNVTAEILEAGPPVRPGSMLSRLHRLRISVFGGAPISARITDRRYAATDFRPYIGGRLSCDLEYALGQAATIRRIHGIVHRDYPSIAASPREVDVKNITLDDDATQVGTSEPDSDSS